MFDHLAPLGVSLGSFGVSLGDLRVPIGSLVVPIGTLWGLWGCFWLTLSSVGSLWEILLIIFCDFCTSGWEFAGFVSAGHMKWMQEFGKLSIAYGIELQHIRNDFNYQRASRSLLRQV